MRTLDVTRIVAPAALCVFAWGASAMGQDAAGCVPGVEILGTPPPRLAARFRALVRSLPVTESEDCHASRVQVAWTPQQLSIVVALNDGRVANRTLHSIDDVLPTLLAVLADPDDPAVEVPPERVRPVRPPARVEAMTDDEALPVRTAAARRPTPMERWGVYARAELGLTTPVSTGDGLVVGSVEAGASHGTLRLGLRGLYGVDNDGSSGSRTGSSVDFHRRYTQQTALVLTLTHRATLGRFGVEVGGLVGTSWSSVYDDQGGTLDDALALRVGVSSALVLPLVYGTEVFLRGELSTDVRPAVTSSQPVALAGLLSVGVGWGSPR